MLSEMDNCQRPKGGGIIEQIPKRDAEPNLIKNWRPITLLNLKQLQTALKKLSQN